MIRKLLSFSLLLVIIFCGCQRQATITYSEAIAIAENYLKSNGYELKKEISDYQYGEQTKITAENSEKKYEVTFYYVENNELPVEYKIETSNLYYESSQIYTKIDYELFENLAKALGDTDTNANEIKKAVEDKRDYYDDGHPDGPDAEGYKMVKIYEQNFGSMRVLYYLRGGDKSNMENVTVQGLCG